MRSRKSGTSPFSLFAFQDIITSVTGIMILVTMMLALELMHRKANSPKAKTPEIDRTVASAVEQNESEIERLQAIVNRSAEAMRYDSETVRKRLEELRRVNSELAEQNKDVENELADSETRRTRLDQQMQELNPQTLDELQQELQTTRKKLEELRASNRVIYNRPQGESKTPWLVEIDAGGVRVAEVDSQMQPLTFSTGAEFATWATRQDAGSLYFVLLLKPSGLAEFEGLRSALRDDGFDVGYDLLAADQHAIDPGQGGAVR